MATITTPDAVPGEVIEAAWGDAVRTDLNNLNTEAMARIYRAGDNSIGTLLIGKAASAIYAPGIELAGYGAAAFTFGATGASVNVSHINASDVNGQPFLSFLRYDSYVGSIAQSAGGVVYNTTSDKRLKTLTRPVDPDEATDKVTAMEPVHFTVNAEPDAGEQIGFFAQDLYPVAPEAVTPGSGEPGDEPDPDVPGSGFRPWGIDAAKLVPTLVAAIQALTRRVEALEAAT